MIVYGKNVLNQLQDDPSQIQEIFIQENFRDKKLLNAISRLKVKTSTVNRAYLDRLTDKGIHQGIAARVKDIPFCTVEELISRVPEGEKGFFIALDELQDPHNLGAILRTADAVGAHGVLITRHNSAGLTPAAIKASTGAAYTVPVAQVTNMSNALDTLREAGYWAIATDFENARDYREGVYDVPLVLVIGNEGKGISRNVKKHCDYAVTLPMKGSVQSLNASVAAGILMYEILSRRNPLAS